MNDSRNHDSDRFGAVLADYLSQVDRGETPDRQAFLAAHPELADDLAGYFEVQDRMERLAATNHGAHPTFGAQGTPSHPVLTHNGAPLPTGSLLGQYRLEEVIGEGAMGRIYRATHLHLDRTLAIKVLSPNFSNDTQLVQRFQREARALASLVHPNIVAIHDMGSQGDVHYFVMEFVRGENLRQLMAHGRVEPDRALEIVAAVCDALHFAHDRGIVHRDIKPENILLEEGGHPRVVDFGLAKVLQDEHPSANLTGTNVVLGTYNYMAPEQKTSSRVDHRADIYAVGVVLYELLTGKLPAGHFEPPSHATRVAPGVDALVLKALHSEPDRRQQSAHDLRSDIEAVRRGESGPAPTPGPAPYRDMGTRRLAVVDSKTDLPIGEQQAAWLRIVLADDEALEIRTWSRPEIGIATDGRVKKVVLTRIEGQSSAWIGTPADSLPGLEVRLPNNDATVHVPEDLPLRVASCPADLTVSSMRAPLCIDPGAGTVKVRDHTGRLQIERTESGSVSVSGLQSQQFVINTRNGRIVMNGLRLRSGQGKLHSDEGAIDVGVDEAHCGFRFEARTLSGELSNSLESESSPPGRSSMEGAVGRGDGRLDLDSFSGDIRLGEQGESEWVFEAREAGRELFWAAICVMAAFAWGNAGLGWIVFWFWGVWALWRVVKPVVKAQPWSNSRISKARQHQHKR